jgi:hypothetical protein
VWVRLPPRNFVVEVSTQISRVQDSKRASIDFLRLNNDPHFNQPNMYTVTASWIFNRLCDEPELLKNELVTRMNLELSRGTASFTTLEVFFKDYQLVQEAEALAVKIKMESKPEIEVVNDHKHLVVSVR